MSTFKITGSVLPLCIALVLPAAGAADKFADLTIQIPFTKVVLTNGLTVIVHEDHKAPLVAVDIWYRVGSADEKPGRTGFAHLFEHLMFQGSEHFKGEGNQRAFYEAMEKIGANNPNGSTYPDQTKYYETVPTNGLDLALWIESDRMGYLLATVDQARLDLQRGVVQNEKRQGENQPYGKVWQLIAKGTAPPGHPYSWLPIGSMEDLNAASLEDVHNWFKTHYGAANAVLVLAGDIATEAALEKAKHYFGDLPAGPPVLRIDQWFPEMHGTRRETLHDRVPQSRIYKVWNIPAYGERENEYLRQVGGLLSWGKNSRLYKRLVYDEQLATDVDANASWLKLSGLFVIQATARPGVNLERIEKAIDEELAKLREKGPTTKELERVKAQQLAQYVRNIERVMTKAEVLAQNETYRGTPGFYETILKYRREATVRDLRDAARRWLNQDVYVLEVHPYPNFENSQSRVDRSRLPTPGAPPEPGFPAFERTTLSNGMKVVLAERHSTPLVNMHLLIDSGSAADPPNSPGTARLTLEMLPEGTTHRTALEISEELDLLGARLATESDLDSCSVGLSAVTSTLDAALPVYADVIFNPSFPETDFERVRKNALARVQREKVDPVSMALRVFPRLLYGSGHAYSSPMTGSGTETSLAALKRSDLQKFHATWFRPNNATLVIVGDTSLKEITPKLEKYFGPWKPGAVPTKNLGTVEHQKKTAIYLVDRPDSIQSLIFAGHVAPPRSDPDEIAFDTMNTILGGAVSARVDMNLRESKHWSYGSFTWFSWANGQSPFIVYAPVQADKTSEAMVELDKELRGILGPRPITAEELDKAQKNLTLSLPGSWETDDAIIRSMVEIVRFGLPEDYFATYPGKVRRLSVRDVTDAAQRVLHPDKLVWVVVGDRAKIESGIRALGWGDPQFLDADGSARK